MSDSFEFQFGHLPPIVQDCLHFRLPLPVIVDNQKDHPYPPGWLHADDSGYYILATERASLQNPDPTPIRREVEVVFVDSSYQLVPAPEEFITALVTQSTDTQFATAA